MFFLLSMSHNLEMQPNALGPQLKETLIKKLHQEVEGLVHGTKGYVIAVTTVDEIGKGKVLPYSGLVSFPIKYKAIAFRPFKGEVLDASVTDLNKHGLFAEAGPLRIFVSTHMMPEDMEYDPHGAQPCYANQDASTRISKEDEIRLKIVGMKMEATEITLVGSIKEDYLGSLS